MTTDTSEKGLERLICAALTGAPCDPPQAGAVRERPAGYGAGWICGDSQDYDREYCVDLVQLAAFLRCHPARCRRVAGSGPGQSDAAQVPGPAARGSHQAWHH